MVLLRYTFSLASRTGLIKTAVGVTAGGLVGMILFRSGRGGRAAAVATGAGLAAGSTYERIRASMAKE